jgi:branched-chain amino acid transport system ATP-binding protein
MSTPTSSPDRPPVFRTEGLTIRYGGLVANKDVSLEVRAGEVVGLIGPNGAGKTSFVDAVTGFTSSSGAVHLGDRRIDALSAHDRRRAGLARTWQAGELFEQLTVEQNIAVVFDPGGVRSAVRDIFRHGRAQRVLRERVAEVLELMELGDVADRLPTELSLGHQKLVGVARAVAADVKVVFLDEPGAGLSSSESQAFGRSLQKIVGKGVGVLLIDHDMDLIMNFAQRIVVLDFGEVIATGDPASIAANPAVIQAYLGAPHVDPAVAS